MLTVTEPALHRLSRRLARRKAAEGMALRFVRREGGWKLCVDHESAGDTTFTHEGKKVLLLDEDVAKAMADLTLDSRPESKKLGLKLYRDPPRED